MFSVSLFDVTKNKTKTKTKTNKQTKQQNAACVCISNHDLPRLYCCCFPSCRSRGYDPKTRTNGAISFRCLIPFCTFKDAIDPTKST